MQIKSEQLINDLLLQTDDIINRIQQLQKLTTEEQNHKSSPAAWSILECLEHLNLYGDYYLPEMERQIAKKVAPASHVFTSGLIGNYFANLMLVKDGKIQKMKSPKNKVPAKSDLNAATIDRCLQQQERLKTILIRARQVNLAKTKTAISISKLVKLRLGDTFRFYVYHIERHVQQAERCVSKLAG